MTQLTPTIAAEVVAACRAGAAEAAAALGKALDSELTLAVEDSTTYAAEKPPSGFDGPGLIVLLKFGDAGLAAVLPEASGLLPSWYGAPDSAGASKLSTLARELSLLLVPESLKAQDFSASRVANIGAALARAAVASDATLAPLNVASGANSGRLSLIWPLAAPAAVFDETPLGESPAGRSGASDGASGSATRMAKPADFSQLPSYSRSLLKIAVPVSVRLAAKKETVQEVVEIVPGSIIKFEKGCDELLQMIIGGQQIAEGEAVKIGDKFGFRVTAMLLPSEHFIPLKRRRTA